jgi:hypothetical protein
MGAGICPLTVNPRGYQRGASSRVSRARHQRRSHLARNRTVPMCRSECGGKLLPSVLLNRTLGPSTGASAGSR